MSVLMVQACKCDRCGHIWLADSPKRCSKCKSMRWNLSFVDQTVEQARKVGAIAVKVNETVIRVVRCDNPKHTGFQRSDGYWCIDCRRMY